MSAFGVISPHPPIFIANVGGERADVTRASLTALHRVAHALDRYDPDTIVLMSPHAPALADAFLVDSASRFSGSLAQFGDPSLYSWTGDPELADAIAHEIASVGHSVALRAEDDRFKPGWLDHATIVPLSFLDPSRRFRLVVLSLSYLGYPAHRDVGAAVSVAADRTGRSIAFVASGDLSHRLTPDAPAGFSPHARELDAAIVDRVSQGRFADLMHLDEALIEAGGECGLRSIVALGGFCGEEPVPTRTLAYEGPWGVGYLTALVGEVAVGLDAASTPPSGIKGGSPSGDDSAIVRLARAAIEARVAGGVDSADRPAADRTSAGTSSSAIVSGHPRTPDAATPIGLADAAYPERAGVFVSLHRRGELRGCIGTIAPTRESLAEEVTANAIEAALNDPRFPPLAADELADLDVKVDVLHDPEPATLADLDPTRYGVIVTSGWRRGLLLPDLEGVDDIGTQVSIALRKAGIGPDERYVLQRFRVDRYT